MQEYRGPIRTYQTPFTLRPVFSSLVAPARTNPSSSRHYRVKSRLRDNGYSPYFSREASLPFHNHASYPFGPYAFPLDPYASIPFDNPNFAPAASGGFGFQQGYYQGSPFHARQDDMDDDMGDDDDDEDDAETERLLYYNTYAEHGVQIESAPVEDPPVQSAPVQSAPVEDAPVQSAPVQSAPVQSAPVQSAPVQSAPVQSAPVRSAPVQSAPVEDAPVQSAPVQSAPVQSAPVQSAPVQSAPVQSAPAPVQSAPVQSAPVQSAPVESAPVAPVENAPPIRAIGRDIADLLNATTEAPAGTSYEGRNYGPMEE